MVSGKKSEDPAMTRHLVALALALVVAFTAAAYADAADKGGDHTRKGRVSMGMIVFTKHVDKSSS